MKAELIVLAMAPGGYWTTNHILLWLNVVLVIATATAAAASVFTIKSSNRVAKAAEDQAEKTTDSVKAAMDQVDLGRVGLDQDRQALEASIRPIIVVVPYGEFADRSIPQPGLVEDPVHGVVLNVTVKNIGPGAAFVFTAVSSTAPGSLFDAWCDHEVIPSGSTAVITTDVDQLHSALKTTGDEITRMSVALRYSDIAGRQRTQTEIVLKRDYDHDDRTFVTVGVNMYRCGDQWIRETDPFVRSGPN